MLGWYPRIVKTHVPFMIARCTNTVLPFRLELEISHFSDAWELKFQILKRRYGITLSMAAMLPQLSILRPIDLSRIVYEQAGLLPVEFSGAVQQFLLTAGPRT